MNETTLSNEAVASPEDDVAVDNILRGLEEVGRAGQSVSRESRRWQLVVFPSLLAFFILAAYGFYLLFSVAKDIHYLAISLDSNGTVVSSNLQSISDNMGQMSANARSMAVSQDAMARDLSTLEPMLTSIAGMDLSLNGIGFLAMGLQQMRSDYARMVARVDPDDGEAERLLQAILNVQRAEFGEMSVQFVREAAFQKEMLEVAGRSSEPVWRAVDASVARLLAGKAERLSRANGSSMTSYELESEVAGLLSAYACLGRLEGPGAASRLDQHRQRFRQELQRIGQEAGGGSQVAATVADALAVLDEVGQAVYQPAAPAAPADADAEAAPVEPRDPNPSKMRRLLFRSLACGYRLPLAVPAVAAAPTIGGTNAAIDATGAAVINE
jgi:hypothetical protein